MQPVEHQSTSPMKCVQQKQSSTGETADAQWEAPSKLLAVDDPLLLLEQEVHGEIGIDWFLEQGTPSHPEGGYVRILAESLLLEDRLDKTRIRVLEGLTTCMEPHRGWTIASSSWNLLRQR